jgi:hypothetical protein
MVTRYETCCQIRENDHEENREELSMLPRGIQAA